MNKKTTAEGGKKFDITALVNNDGCFDLQFRKDTRHERTGSPTYYRWKIQFIITRPKADAKLLKKVANTFRCGTVGTSANQARFSVQNITDIKETIVPYFQKNTLAENKKKDFQLWQKAVEVVWRNKGVKLSAWKKHDLAQLMEIHKAAAKYKLKPRSAKWIETAKTLTKTA
jgi:hypothetical protein